MLPLHLWAGPVSILMSIANIRGRYTFSREQYKQKYRDYGSV